MCIKYNIKNFNELFDLSLYMVKNPGISINSVKKSFNIKDIDLYIEYFEKSGIIFKINDINDNSMVFYTVDNGFTNLGNLIDRNRLIENAIAKRIVTEYENYSIFKDNDIFIVEKGRKEVKRIKIDIDTLTGNYI